MKRAAGSFLSPPPVEKEDLLDHVREAAVPGSSEAGGAAAETQTAAPHPTSLPKRLGQYHIKRVIATAGMGTVYEATQEKPRRTVAVKVMKHGIASRSALRRFEYESRVLARLRHPGIAQVYEAGTHRDESGTVPFFAVEYIPNAKSITRYADDKKLGTRERLDLLGKFCDSVHHGHQKGIIHRDLKPSNILGESDNTRIFLQAPFPSTAGGRSSAAALRGSIIRSTRNPAMAEMIDAPNTPTRVATAY